MYSPTATFREVTPAGTPGAVGVIEITGDVDAALSRAGIKPVGVGEVRLRDLCTIDTGVVARWSHSACTLMPHGGRGVVRALCEALRARGIREHALSATAPPNNSHAIEAAMLETLARAASPAAIDLLLDQPRRHAAGWPIDPAIDHVLHRLIEPACVVAWGGANIGKSTLINALAGRGVSIVADEPGTTLDHVGVLFNLGGTGGGVVARYVDTPGVRTHAGDAEHEGVAMAAEVLRRADLVLRLGDATTPPVALPAGVDPGATLTIALRTDLGQAAFGFDLGVCAKSGEGLDALRALIRERLVPKAALEADVAWRFWEAGRG
ncbi:MAG: 50S ribosome-binding GTPase [Phycisphaerales bacterium]|nr:50S ribosome-binding GTPase [Phycisphaerales bacterium]